MNSRSTWHRGTLTVKEIADWIDRSEIFVRKSIENGSLAIGAYTRQGSRGTYYISPKLAWERLGYRRDEESDYNNDPVTDHECFGSDGCREGLGNGLLSDRDNSEWHDNDSTTDGGREERVVRQRDTHMA